LHSRTDRAGKERADHERAVAAFFAKAKEREPARVAEVFKRHTVYQERTLEALRELEVSAFAPADEAGGDFEDEETHQGAVVSGLAAVEEAARLRRISAS
jgi:hypothetical protein